MKKKHYLTKVQEQAVRMIFEGGKHRAVAEGLGISEATLSNWKKLPGGEKPWQITSPVAGRCRRK